MWRLLSCQYKFESTLKIFILHDVPLSIVVHGNWALILSVWSLAGVEIEKVEVRLRSRTPSLWLE